MFKREKSRRSRTIALGAIGALLLGTVLMSATGVSPALLQGKFNIGISETGKTEKRLKLGLADRTLTVGEAAELEFSNVRDDMIIYRDTCGKLFEVQRYAGDGTYVPMPGAAFCSGIFRSESLDEKDEISVTIRQAGKYRIAVKVGEAGSTNQDTVTSYRFRVELPEPTTPLLPTQ